jgi:histidinol-phosphatase (PHP family)
MINFNFHQHTIFSDGKEEPEKYIEEALKLKFKAMGFSEHSPLPFETPFSLKQDNITRYVNEIEKLKKKYSGQIAVYRALELDYIPGLSEDFEHWKDACKTDYSIGGVHLVKPGNTDALWFTDGPDRNVYDSGIESFFDNDIRKAVTTYYHQLNRMIETQTFDVVAHVDKIKMHNQDRFFKEDEKWYRNLVSETLTLIKEKQLIAEINTRGIYKKRSEKLFPDDETLRQVVKMKIPVIISSDAHKPGEINLFFDYAVKRLIESGGKSVWFFNGRTWEERAL